MSTITSPRRQESHRVYLQQFIQNSATLESSINTTSAAIRLTLAATCQDVTQLLRQKFGLRPLQPKRDFDKGTSSGSLSALDRINARLGRNNSSSDDLKKKQKKRIYDRTQHDALVVVASCFVPSGYLRYEHESKISTYTPPNGLNQQQQGQDQSQQVPTLEAFNIFRTLLPDENPLQVKNEMWSKAQHVQEEAHILFGESDDSSTASSIATGIHTSRSPRRDRARNKPPIIRLFFVPCHDNSATIEIEGYCTDADSDDDEDYNDNDDDNVYSGSKSKKDCQPDENFQMEDEDTSVPQWKCELELYRYTSCREGITLSQEQQNLVRERHQFAILSGLEASSSASSGDGCISGYLFKLSERDSNVWKRFHCVLPNNQQFWYVSRVKDVEAAAGADEGTNANSNMITSKCIGKHGIIHLNGTLLMESIDPTLPLSGIPCQLECTFQLITKEGKTHTFRAGSRNAYSRWMHCISESIVRCQENSYFDLAEEMVRSLGDY